MTIRNEAQELPLLEAVRHLYVGRDGRREETEELILCEHTVTAAVNGREAFRSVCLGEHLPELILGHLLTEGYIRSAAEVGDIFVSPDGKRAEAALIADAPTPPYRELSPVRPIPCRAEWIFALADRFADGMPLHSVTFATHSVFLGREGECLFSCEDIGRHNALDKAVGYALLRGIDPTECYLYSSGRLPLDMVSKAIRAGIPVLAGKASPTAESVSAARRYGLTLFAAARRDRMKLFSGTLTGDVLHGGK